MKAMLTQGLRVLHVSTHLNVGGITRYVSTLSSALVKKGHSVSVVSAGGELAADLEAQGVRCHTFPIRTKNEFNPKLFFSLPAINHLVIDGKFDVLHAHTRVTQVLANLVSEKTKVPLVTTVHGFYKTNLGRRLFPSWGKRAIAISPLVAKELKEKHGVEDSRIAVVMNGIDVEGWNQKFRNIIPSEVRREAGIPEKAIVVGSVSRLVQDKGHEFLIRAVAKLRTRFPALCVAIVGDGREKGKLEALAGELDMESAVFWFPELKEIAGILSVMDIFVHPATYREGFGLSIAEAMTAGKPVIVTDIPALNSIFTNGQDAMIVKPSDAEALAEAICRLIENPSESAALAERGRGMASKLCALDRWVGEIENVYREVAGKNA